MNWRTSSRSLPATSAGGPLAMMRPAGKQVAVVGDRGDLADVVRDDDAGDAERVVEAPDEPQHDAHRDRVESHERLVVHEELGIHHDRARERDAPRHAARELRRHQPGRAAQPHGLQLGQHQVAHQALRQPRVLPQRERDVLVDVEVGQQRAVLEQHAHAAAHPVQRRARQLRDFLAVELDEAPVRAGLPRDEPEQRRLAAAARAHDRRDRPAREIEVDSGKDLAAARAVVQAADANDRAGPATAFSTQVRLRGGGPQAAACSIAAS